MMDYILFWWWGCSVIAFGVAYHWAISENITPSAQLFGCIVVLSILFGWILIPAASIIIIKEHL